MTPRRENSLSCIPREDCKKRFEAIDKRFDEIDRRFEAIDKRFEAIDKKFEAVDKRFDVVEKRLDAVEKRLDAVEKRLDSIDKRLDTMDEKLRYNGVLMEEIRDTVKLLFEAYSADQKLKERVVVLEHTTREHDSQIKLLQLAVRNRQ